MRLFVVSPNYEQSARVEIGGESIHHRAVACASRDRALGASCKVGHGSIREPPAQSNTPPVQLRARPIFAGWKMGPIEPMTFGNMRLAKIEPCSLRRFGYIQAGSEL
jgi:hypothetical protein